MPASGAIANNCASAESRSCSHGEAVRCARSISSAAPNRATATSGPKSSHAAAVAGIERAAGPGPHPHPRYGSARAFMRSGKCCSAAPARMNGTLSINVAADVTSNAVTTPY